MTRFIPKLTVRRAIAGTLVAALAAVPLVISSTAGAANAVPRCTTRGLEVWLGVGGGGAAAGSTFYPMEFSNVSRHTCQLFGFRARPLFFVTLQLLALRLIQPLFNDGSYVDQLLETLPGGVSGMECFLPLVADIA